MKLKLLAGLALAAASLCACSTVSSTDLASTINALASAGCSGTLSNEINAQSASGLSAGSWGVKHTFTGACDPAKAVKPAAAPPAATAP